ncbi:helix-turn-helix domain-containing protein [Vreelandella andesensis]|uniref:Helix-turn-helix domain-containing protein n=1 Tax=Vreelandella andesensis TaxID=447567 RepID=A0A433KEV9_9GAMM|nr:helix-turn-helix domain-containing protein [Halomonas andesensis]RUR26814.1 helix-turn-helix domain-containing protein [Halomonas andesensis]
MRLEPDKRELFGERLKQACAAKYGKEHGMASRLAEDMDVSAQTASKWLRGLVVPDVDKWAELAANLNVSAQWLTGSVHEQPHSLRHSGDADAKAVGQAATIVFPLVQRLKPEISQDELDGLMKQTYAQLKAKRDPAAISGDIANKLL